ncbi:MAG: CHAT domain-containing protein [Nitrospirae bacterium]|nr:CHAT domain-containing protein [Nitrospirota bacterium]
MKHLQRLSSGSLFLPCLLLTCLTANGEAADSTTADQYRQQGRQAYQRGSFSQAIEKWDQAANAYEQAGNRAAQTDVLIQIADAYHNLGRYAKAGESLDRAHRLALQLNDPGRQARILTGLGVAATGTGQLEEAQRVLAAARSLAQPLGQPYLSAQIHNNLGNLALAQQKPDEALAAYGEAITLATDGKNLPLRARARSNQAALLARLDRPTQAKEQLDLALVDLQDLPPSHDHAYALITIGLAYERILPQLPQSRDDLLTLAYEAYQLAAQEAETVGSPRATSYAWGYLGRLYELDGQHDNALELTRRAILSGQQAAAPEALYRWHWQEGRLFAKVGHYPDALGAYRRAVFALQSVRADLLASVGASTGSFRAYAGGIYYDFADLLLQRAADVETHGESEPYLKEARDVVEMLKVDELRNYFGDECVDAARSRIATLESVATTAAVIYPIALPDRLEILVSLPTGLQHFMVPVGLERLTEEVRVFRQLLEKRTTNEYLPHAQQLYEWLVRPLERELETHEVSTLVFVPDGALRTIPMAALHNGHEFVIQRYGVATTPGLTLTDPRPMKRQTVQALTAGLTEAVQGFSALPNVAEEVRMVHQLFGGALLLNKDFLVLAVETELKEKSFSMVHIASHGQFENDPRNSFLLAYDEKLTMDRLDQFVSRMKYRDEPLALLTLSACETAAGDDRAALGLAGVAIKAGARSALATLWFISDEASSVLVMDFYRQLRDASLSKATALQRAQLKLLEHPMFQHPAYWAPFLLLNNWL